MIEEVEVSGVPGAWFVAFYGKGYRQHWWDWILPMDRQHVMAFGYSAHAERWLVYDVTAGQTFIRALTKEAFVSWLRILPAHRKILLVESGVFEAPPRWRFGFWCVPAVAHLIGVRSRALRPAAFYRDLLRLGATPAFEVTHS
jgi:hypothetical protein